MTIFTLIQSIEHAVLPMGAFGVFLAEIIEEIVAPIPSALVLLTAGFVFLKGAFSFALLTKLIFVVVIPGALGLTLGSLFVYYIFYYGGKIFIDAYGSFFGITWSEIVKFEEKMKGSAFDEYLFLSARIVPLVPSVVIAVYGGVTRMDIKKYILLTFVGSLIKAFILGLIGYKVGSVYSVYAQKIASVENAVLIGICICAVFFIGYRMYRKYTHKK